jgi:hypothetical protein
MEHFFHTIHGWMNCRTLYEDMVRRARQGDVFVEVGAWKGSSAAFMAVEIINSGKVIDFHVVDNFQGSEEHQDYDEIKNKTLYAEFCQNLKPVQGLLNLQVHKCDSTWAASKFAAASIAFCYIDASHDYRDVKADLLAWLPKMKPGGILAGDDFESWPGVGRAVSELLPAFTREGNIWRVTCPST